MDFTLCEDDLQTVPTTLPEMKLVENSIKKNDDDLNSDSRETGMVSMTNDFTKIGLESEETCLEVAGSSYTAATFPLLDKSYDDLIMPKDSNIATICCDENSCAVVTDMNWFRISTSQPDWIKHVINILLRLQVKTVIANGLMAYKEMNLNWQGRVFIEYNNRLKYPCGICNKRSCAVQKAYLTWKRCVKRTCCFLNH